MISTDSTKRETKTEGEKKTRKRENRNTKTRKASKRSTRMKKNKKLTVPMSFCVIILLQIRLESLLKVTTRD